MFKIHLWADLEGKKGVNLEEWISHSLHILFLKSHFKNEGNKIIKHVVIQ